MFRRFTFEDLTAFAQVKSSVQRGIRSRITDQFPMLDPIIDDLIPKKSGMFLAKYPDHISIVVVNSEPLFFNIRDGPYCPTLHLLHKYPNMLPHFRIDKGGIKFIFGGANVMAPGLTSAGGSMEDVEAERPVALMAEGKQHALGIGFTTMSTAQIREENKGVAVETVHFLNDGLWKTTEFK